MSNQKKQYPKRIEGINGIRGCAAFLVMMYHIMLAIYPATFFPDTSAHSINGLDVQFSQNPLNVIINGSFWVNVFCVISGMVIFYQIVTADNMGKISKTIVKRYFRLALPVFFACVYVYLLLLFIPFKNGELASVTHSPWLVNVYPHVPSFREVFSQAFIRIWFFGESYFSNGFWVLATILKGSFLSILLGLVFRENKGNRVLLLFGLAFVLFLRVSNGMAPFICGCIICGLYLNKKIMHNRVLSLLLIAGGLFLGGYPSYVSPTNFVYRILSRFLFASDMVFVWHCVGAFVFLFGCLMNFQLCQWMEGKAVNWLGNKSFSLYLVHIPTIYCVTPYIFLVCNEKVASYSLSAIITVILTVGVNLMVTVLFHYTAERLCNYLQEKIVQFFLMTK